MCGRYNLRLSGAQLQVFFDLIREPSLLSPRYNIAPSQKIAVIRQTESGRECQTAVWGMRAPWNPSQLLINARAETVFESRAFRSSVLARRCLVPVSGFYEWKAEGRKKAPYHIWLQSGDPIAFAGFVDAEGAVCTMTTSPNAEMAAIHDRMPVILPRSVWELYLDSGIEDPQPLAPLLVPLPDGSLMMQAVNPIVNNARHETPACIEPAAPIEPPVESPVDSPIKPTVDASDDPPLGGLFAR